MIEIRLLNKQLLSEFINSREYQKLKHLPISKHRAISHIKNPRANDTDILLLLAFQNKQLVGYLGVLPEQIINNNKVEKWGWLSCLWIDEHGPMLEYHAQVDVVPYNDAMVNAEC